MKVNIAEETIKHSENCNDYLHTITNITENGVDLCLYCNTCGVRYDITVTEMIETEKQVVLV